MNLISCDSCGVVLDASKLKFPGNIYCAADYSIDRSKAGFNGEEWVAKVTCPVCGGEILSDVGPK